MILDPIHPMVVHFPIVLVVILPLFVVVSLLRARDGRHPARAWSMAAAVAVALFVSAFAAVRTGEAQEERVEEVVGETPLHEHEEAAERFLGLSGVLALVATAGLVRGRAGEAARWLTTAGSFGLLLAGIRVGSSGGDLVYRHGAASAYVTAADGSTMGGGAEASQD
jgi:uncharacterized membrane protein